MPSSSNVQTLRFPNLITDNINISSSETNPLTNYLPKEWKLNERNEIINEEGLVMVDIQEEFKSNYQEETSKYHSHSTSTGTLSDQFNNSNHTHELPKNLSKILDQLELEEELELNDGRLKVNQEEEEGGINDHDDQLEFNDNDWIKERQEILKVFKKDKEDLKDWGKNGLEGLKNVFNSNSSSKLEKTVNHNDILKIEKDSEKIQHEEKNVNGSNLKKSSKVNKKSVSFAIETEIDDEDSSDSIKKTSLVESTHLPSSGIMLSDIIEHPIEVSQPIVLDRKRLPINGKNAHLNPRLASLLPRSYVKSQTTPNSSPKATECGSSNKIETVEESHEENSHGRDEEYDYDSDIDGSSVWSMEDEGDEAEWPPNDLDIQAALDLRQAALEYHTKRQSLGIGAGTGPLGGDHPPTDPDQEPEWVPMDTRPKADGIPRQAPSSSRFKSGRLPTWEEPGTLYPKETNVVNGKLFGSVPVINGPEPSNGPAIYQLPGRTNESTDLDEDLTNEEMELLKSRLNILSMDQESRLAAETAGTALMSWMEKARKGEVIFKDDNDDEKGNEVNDKVVERLPVTDTNINEDLDSGSDHKVYLPRLMDQPPEIKTVPKSAKFFPKPVTCESNLKSKHTSSPTSIPTEVLKPTLSPQSTTTEPIDHTSNSVTTTTTTTKPQIKSETTPQTHTVAKKVSRFKAEKIGQCRS
ncbi:hypothetical protein CROQUDRAFT_132450 [Cronartium quercuum f. sp. fusiforme G11]|uniref:Uncharacterized protein n=1 Tax=Cronartium quercuum f. sp. fusiforme G11 TaxID=708437 RepID=A0A9P6TEA1_9BASI|nr:hypothetical protein CROQUDRAFT_132450 [Cronartium quercuum f. sp. fusiforme G11]